ncbi:MAG: bifunctional 5,10-methylenetetrahydrofolate dehydrogenase/5,10-methenyltetrahydrofolate cyclohydrolase [Candidatus Nanopelagicus sp.]|jgi:methylenetetrahydrofolate dehydrogenase (NADP+)/methenyltetrahydrofolate cyclohydrolase
MSALKMDGKVIAERIRKEIADKVAKLSTPIGLGTILVGSDPGSVAYVDGKHKDCAEVGIKSIKVNLPDSVSTADVVAAVNKLNQDPNCTGFIVQLPLPSGIDVQEVLSAIDPKKDADGLTPTNLGNLVLSFNEIIPCTPKAIVALLSEYKIKLSGSKVLIIGRGLTVGRPLSILLSQKAINATITLAHSATSNLSALIKESDVVIAAIGSAHFVKPEMVKPGAVIVDVGITRVDNKLVGDVDPTVAQIASAMAPMPGGVGPLTRAMLLQNVFELATNER